MLSLGLNASFLLAGVFATGAIAIGDPGPQGTSADPFLFGNWAPMGARECWLVALLAVLIVTISAGVAKAYQSSPPAIIATFDYAYLVFADFWGFTFFSERPDTATVIGMILIAGAGVLVVRRPRSTRRLIAADKTT